MSRAIVALIGILVLAGVGVWAMEASLAQSGDANTITNETWTPNTGSFVSLNQSDRDEVFYDEHVTVYNASNVTMEEGVDYEWRDLDGTVQALSGGDLDGEPSANITYGYSIPTQSQRSIGNLLGQIPGWVGPLAPVFVFLIALRWML